MGTRALVNFVDDGQTICTLYRQFDGHPDGLGTELRTLCDGVTLRDGFSVGVDKWPTHANGIGCLAAQVVRNLKTRIGNVYLVAPDTHDVGEEYIYTVKAKGERVQIICQEAGDRRTIRIPKPKKD